ncbi:MAG: hypothetical protein M3Z08_18850 [Chloroflexota bacterium]|nr:hypothetical protein [Chloroflexota bacterium]
MAKALDGITPLNSSTVPARALRAVAGLRLALGLAALLGALVFLEGTSWDIQWHSYIGRDRTLIPPHLMMLSGVALSGVAGLLTVLIESWWARRNQLVVQHSQAFAGVFAGPLGSYVVGYAALLAAVAFPLDAYWHTLYGIDVAIWAPFHIMFVSSMGVVALGAAYMLASVARLAAGNGMKRAATLGVALALATFLSLFTLLLFDALDDGNTINLEFMTLNFFPLLSDILVALSLVVAAIAIPWRWAATLVAACYLFLAGIMAVFVRPATDWLLTKEGLHYLRSHPPRSAVALEWFLMPLVVAFLVDIIVRRAQCKSWSRGKLTLILALIASLSGALPVIAIHPFLPVSLFLGWGITGFLVSNVLGFAGAYLGALLGRSAGESLSVLEK